LQRGGVTNEIFRDPSNYWKIVYCRFNVCLTKSGEEVTSLAWIDVVIWRESNLN
jgi:hypothetical protein